MRAFLGAGQEPADFDPVAEGAAYDLDGEQARAIWRRAQRETRDEAAAKRRFHLEARATARPAEERPAVGRRTLLETESASPERALPKRGRFNLIAFEARQEPVAIHRKAESGVVDDKAADLVAAARMGGVPLDG